MKRVCPLKARPRMSVAIRYKILQRVCPLKARTKASSNCTDWLIVAIRQVKECALERMIVAIR
jgi:hypothetical protein